MELKYETKVLRYGEDREELGDDLIILFGEQVPETLEDFCYIIDISKVNGNIEVGDVLEIGNIKSEIIGVGDQAQINLEQLGHLSIYSNINVDEILPGAIIISNNDKIDIEKGTSIKIWG